jgi:hypothetical protein
MVSHGGGAVPHVSDPALSSSGDDGPGPFGNSQGFSCTHEPPPSLFEFLGSSKKQLAASPSVGGNNSKVLRSVVAHEPE